MGFYADIAADILEVVADFAVGGPSFTGTRPSGAGVTEAVTMAPLTARTIYFLPAKQESFQRSFPDIQIYTAPWFGYAALGVDIQSGDVYTDGAVSYRITGQPTTHEGYVLAPAKEV